MSRDRGVAGGFVFRHGCSRAVKVVATPGHDGVTILWPEAAGEWTTAFVEVHVDADATGNPHVFVESRGVTDRQYFPAGDRGVRWLNLSFLRDTLTGGVPVTIRGHHLRVAGGPTTLRLFTNNFDLSQPMLILAPHPDDAELAAFGLYSRRDVSIVTVTAGNGGPAIYQQMFPDLVEMYTFKGRIRVIDSVTVPWQGEIPPERCFNLGYFDGRLPAMYDTPNAVVSELHTSNCDVGLYRRYNIGSLLPKESRAATWTNLVEDIVTVLRKTKPGLVLSPHPQLDAHPDHQFTTVALVQALAQWKEPITLLLYTNHADGDTYPCGPAGTLMSLPRLPSQDVVLDSVYSHQLDRDAQRLKLFALESLHDVRDYDGTYFTRALRSNELFYVYDEQSVRQVVETFLASKAEQSVSG